MRISVRLSTPEDMPQVLRLIKELAAFEKEITHELIKATNTFSGSYE